MAAKKKIAPSLVWFDIAADDMERAKKFYKSLFGWKIGPLPGMDDYWHIDTGGDDKSPDGAVMPRQHPGHGITNYIHVPSVKAASAKVVKLGGTICIKKTPAGDFGWFAICNDTEGNTFALWEMKKKK